MPAQDPNGYNLAQKRYLMNSPFIYEETLTSNNYNFQGKPLDVTVNEYEAPTTGGVSLIRSATTSYAYWGASKYYQQKAVKDPGGRISFTDYYLATDSNPGNRGQKYQVFDPKYGGTEATTAGYYSISVPSGSTPTAADMWRYMVTAVPNQYSGQFSYNSWGQPTQVLKLQAATAGSPSTYRYVTTQSYYCAPSYTGTSTTPSFSDGSWGQAIKVVEDYGGINRTTQNLGYTSWGKPNVVEDGAGHTFTTNYDPDGRVLSISENGNPIVTYTYGSSLGSNGQPVGVVDNLSGVEQDISYNASGPGAGLPYSVEEKRGGSPDNTCYYTYGTTGDRLTATYYSGTNTSGTTLAQWGYYDYLSVGSPSKGAHAFQTLCKLDGAGNRTPEEFHYSFDQQGRLFEATFAQTPSNATPDSSGYYDGYEAQTRARAHYEYDAGGRLYWIGHYWDSLANGSTYTSQAIIGQSCDYEYNGLNRGVKTDSIYKMPTSAGSANWSASQTDTYGYDSGMDYLTAAGYGDGLANANPTWSYDAAGNRNDALTDNLNRLTSLGGTAVTSDTLGNRLTMGTNFYSWDVLNRLTTFTSSSGTSSYVYRADGMRVSKSNSRGSTSYRYDGQMAMEDIDFASNGSVSKVTDFGIGSRGIDAIYVTQSGTSSASYPLYDDHGNMISTLSKQGTGGYSYSAQRTFDSWGTIRRGAPTGDPNGRYCANLGHKQDDESGLTYMRSRYYESASGRFVTEDIRMQGENWFTYCNNDPVNNTDGSGSNWHGIFYLGGWISGGFWLDSAIGIAMVPIPWACKVEGITDCLMSAIASLCLSYAVTSSGAAINAAIVLGVTNAVIAMLPAIQSIAAGLSTAGTDGIAAGVVVLLSIESVVLLSLIISCGDDIAS